MNQNSGEPWERFLQWLRGHITFVSAVVSVYFGAVSFVVLILTVPPILRYALIASALSLCDTWLVFAYWGLLLRTAKYLHALLTAVAPWAVLLQTLLLGLALYEITWTRSSYGIVSLLFDNMNSRVLFDPDQGGIFEYPSAMPEILAYGSQENDPYWATSAEGAIGFHYKRNAPIDGGTTPSSGLYITFDDNPRNFLAYDDLHFQCKTGTQSPIEVGIRFAVDVRKSTFWAPTPTIYEVYAFQSNTRSCTSEWQAFDVPMTEFTEVPAGASPKEVKEGIEKHAINKIAFFVDRGVVFRHNNGELWFKDVLFRVHSDK